MSVDVQALDCDFYTLSAHKMYGPTGIGILYGKEWWLEKLPPYQTGGEMIQRVSFSGTIFNQLPYKFEAGTAAIASAVGFNAAIDYLQKIGLPRIQRYEAFLLAKANEALSTIPGLSIIGQATEKAAVISFVLDKIHPHDISTLLDQQGIAIRSGRHCAEPTMERFGVVSTVRASFAMYNTLDEIKRLVEGLEQIKRLFKL
jgi:cysteine desulfurase/selenocysteine lyase